MLSIVWTREMPGMRPGVLLGEDRILLHHEKSGADPTPNELRCFNFEGRQLWSQVDLTGLLSLPGNEFLVRTRGGVPLRMDKDGNILRRWVAGGIDQVKRHGDLLVFADGQSVWLTDLSLNQLGQFRWPGASRPAIDCFAQGAFCWVEQGVLKRVNHACQIEPVGELPAASITDAMSNYERLTGGSALTGSFVALEENAEWKAYQPGERPMAYFWRTAFDARFGRYFLSNCMAPHMIICIDSAGHPCWSVYLSFGCCGGLPQTLPDGRYVASSGCGGILSWFGSDGVVLFQSRPHDGEGLATAFSDEVRVLPDGRVLADGGPGLVAYSIGGERLWVFNRSYSQFQVDAARGILIGCNWENREPAKPNVARLEFVCGL
jgi:hypothetical protein